MSTDDSPWPQQSPRMIHEASPIRYGEVGQPILTGRFGGAASLYVGNCLALLSQVAEIYPDGAFDMIFADPPYFLSNGGITCQNGRMVKVDKGTWDKSSGADEDHEFNRVWIAACQRALKPNGTLWVSGTSHVIHSVGFAMQQLGMKILNDITWEKPNPPPNLSCRYFTHSTETILWSARSKAAKHKFNYDEMRRQAGGKQMKSVWRIAPPDASEKRLGKHPTQKPVALLKRIIQASTDPGDLVFDPFMGSGTTGVAALALGRRFVGIDAELDFVTLATSRTQAAIENTQAALFDDSPRPGTADVGT